MSESSWSDLGDALSSPDHSVFNGPSDWLEVNELAHDGITSVNAVTTAPAVDAEYNDRKIASHGSPSSSASAPTIEETHLPFLEGRALALRYTKSSSSLSDAESDEFVDDTLMREASAHDDRPTSEESLSNDDNGDDNDGNDDDPSRSNLGGATSSPIPTATIDASRRSNSARPCYTATGCLSCRPPEDCLTHSTHKLEALYHDVLAAESRMPHPFFSKFPTFEYKRNHGDLVNFGRFAIMQRWAVGSLDWFIQWRQCFGEDWATTCMFMGESVSSYVEYFARFTPVNYREDCVIFASLANYRGWPEGGRLWRENWYKRFGYRCMYAEQDSKARQARISLRSKQPIVRASPKQERPAVANNKRNRTDTSRSQISCRARLITVALLLIPTRLFECGPMRTLIILLFALFRESIIGRGERIRAGLRTVWTAFNDAFYRACQVLPQWSCRERLTAADILCAGIDAAFVMISQRGLLLLYRILPLIVAVTLNRIVGPNSPLEALVHILIVYIALTDAERTLRETFLRVRPKRESKAGHYMLAKQPTS